jgi:hypothetical protein
MQGWTIVNAYEYGLGSEHCSGSDADSHARGSASLTRMRTVDFAIALTLTALASPALAQDTHLPAPATSTTPAPGVKATPKAAAATASSSPKVAPPAKSTAPARAPGASTAPASAAPASAPAASAAPADPNAPPPPDTSAPPIYYVEPGAPPEQGQEEDPNQVYEPPPPMMLYEPPPPPVVSRRAPPRNGFWAGARVGALIPFGGVWTDGFNGYYRQRRFADYASGGPMFEIDIGARLARRYNVFAMWEHSSLGKGSLDGSSFGSQERGASNLYGVGVRFSTDPTGLGFLMEIALGYRDFRAYWTDGTKLSMTDGWLDARIGIGADIRVNRWLSVSPMLVLGGGSFNSGNWSGPGMSGNALTSQDDGAEYGTLTFQLGGHADVF